MLCVEIQKQNMTFKEVINAYQELTIEETHKEELNEVIRNNYTFDELIEFLINRYNNVN